MLMVRFIIHSFHRKSMAKDDYELVECIYEKELFDGTLREVLRARKADGTEVAIKRNSERVTDEYIGLIQKAVKLSHPNLITPIEFYHDNKSIVEVYPFVNAPTLDEARVPSKLALEIGRQIGGGISYLHANGIAHCDIVQRHIFHENDRFMLFDLSEMRPATKAMVLDDINFFGALIENLSSFNPHPDLIDISMKANDFEYSSIDDVIEDLAKIT